MTIGKLKSIIAGYMGQNAAGLPITVDDFVINGVDLLLLALNNARKSAERIRSFRYAEINATLSIVSNAAGGNLATAVEAGTSTLVTIREIDSVQLPDRVGNLFSVEFMTNDEWNDRIKRQIGRAGYDPTLSLAEMGVYTENPIAYQQGQKIFLYPAEQFSFPTTVTMNIAQFMPDYTTNLDTDFFVKYAPDYLQWQGILEANKLFQQFVARQEGTVDESAVKELAQNALSALLIWDDGINNSTSTPKPSMQSQQNQQGGK